MTEERRITLVTEVDTTGARAGFSDISRQAGAMAEAVKRNSKGVDDALGGLGDGATKASRNVETATRNIIGSIERKIAAETAGKKSSSEYFAELGRQRGIDPKVLEPYLVQLRAVEAEQQKVIAAQKAAAESQRAANAQLAGASAPLRQIGTSAAQTAAALRGVPAQFTDIVTSIQGGQAPLTVFLQQGGQLRDMFGSAGAAARGLGGYVAGLVTPYTVAAAAAVALGFAYSKGAEEAKAYTRALLLTNNAAGATADGMAEAARRIGQIAGDQGAAAGALAALASTGKVPAESMQKFAQVAVESQRVIGRSVADTVADFDALGKAPLTALGAINEKYHFITAATYGQVKALQDQGRAADAANLAQQAYADGIDKQRQKVLDSLSDWERGWIRIKKAASSAVDAVLDFGRGATQFEKINSLLSARETIEANMARASEQRDTRAVASYQRQLDQNKDQINSLRSKGDAEKAAAKAEAEAVERGEARVKWMTEGDKYLTRAAQLERDVTKARNEGAAAGASQAEIDKRISDVRKSYADIFNGGIDSNIAALKRKDQVQDVLTQRELARIAAERAAGSITDDAAINQSAAVELDALDRHSKLIESELALTKRKANSAKEQAELEGQLDVLDAERTSRKIQRETELFALEQKRFRQAAENTANLIEAAMAERNSLVQATQTQTDYNETIGLTKKQIGELTAARLLDLAARKESDADIAEGLDLDGARAKVIRDQAQALRDRAAAVVAGTDKEFKFDEWKKAVDTYEQVFRTGFADMLNNGKAGWHSFTKSLATTFKTTVADQIYKLFAQPFVVQMVASVLGVTVPSGAQAADGSAQGSAGYVSVAQTAKKAYDAISSGFSGIGDSVANGVQRGINASQGQGYSQYVSQNGEAANMAGTAATYAAGIAAGKAIGSAISGKYEIGGHGSAIVNIGTAAGAIIAGPIGAAVGGAIGGFLNRAFGMGPEEIRSRTLTGTLSGNSFSGGVDTAVHRDGGFFRSDDNFTRNTPSDGATSNALAFAYDQIKVASNDFAKTLGLNADSIKDRSQSLSIALTDDQAANQKAITDFFVGVGDSIAKEVLPTISDFSKAATEFGGVGETASATLQRIATDYAFIDTALNALGKTFGAVGIESVTARERLIDMSGGLEAFGKGAAFFAQNYLTEAERLVPVAKSVEKALADMGLSSITTRDQFKDVVLGLDLTTQSGATTYAGLIKIEEAFAQLHPAIESATDAIKAQRQELQDQLDDILLSPEQETAKERAKVDPANAGLFDQIQTATAAKAAADALAAANKNYQDQIDSLMNSQLTGAALRAAETKGMDASTVALYDRLAALRVEVSASKEAADQAIANAKSRADAVQSLGNALADSLNNATAAAKALRDFNDSLLLGNLSALDPEQRYQEAKRQFGASDGTDSSVITAFLQASKDRDVDQFFYQRDFAAAQAKLSGGIGMKEQLAAAIPSLWASIQNPLSTALSPAQSLSPAQTFSRGAAAPDTTSLEAAISDMSSKLEGALATVADNTARATAILDRVTNGGSAMLSEPA